MLNKTKFNLIERHEDYFLNLIKKITQEYCNITSKSFYFIIKNTEIFTILMFFMSYYSEMHWVIVLFPFD